MARGRVISKEITADKKINDLSNDTSRLAFTWLITFADAEGRTYGDPSMVRSMLFPRRDDISTEKMEFYIREWQDAGLVDWYEAEGDLWINFPHFGDHQVGVRADREAPSHVPPKPNITPEQCRSNAGVTQEIDGLIKLNLIESNLIAPNGANELPSIVKNPGALKAMVEGAIKHEGINGQIIDIFHIYPSQTKTWNACIQFLKERPATQTLDVFAAWWFKNHWKGKRDQAPGPNDIMENWPQAFIAPATLEDQGFSYA